MLTKAIEVQRYVKASAGRSSLNVVFEDINQPRHDGNTIYLPKVTTATTEDDLLQIMASTDHEVAHDLYSDFGILQEKHINPMTSQLGFIWNLLEDSRVNALEAKDYEGFRELWDQSNPKLLAEVLNNTKDRTGANVLIKSLIKWETEISKELFPLGYQVGKTIESEPKLDEILDKFKSRLEICQKEYDKKKGSKLTYELTRDIFKALGGDPDEEERKAKEAHAAAEGEKDKKTENGEDEEERIIPKDEEWCIKEVVLKDIDEKLPTTHDTEKSHMSKVGLKHKSTPDKESNWKLASEFIEVNYVKSTCSHSSHTHMLNTSSEVTQWFTDKFNSRVRGKAITSENFAQQVRRLIQIRSRVKYEYGVKRGKLDQARLSRLALNAPGFQDRVFKNKISNTVLNAAVTVLVDMSGSMSGDKAFFACESTVLLNNVFQVLQVPLEIIGFTDHGETPLMFVYKPFNKQRLSEDDLVMYIGASSGSMSGNPDGDCILWTYDRLLKRKEKKRVLIVMSDGQPAATRREYGCSNFTLKAIREIEQARKIEIYGLGLCDESVKMYYKHHSTVNRPEEIPQRLLELIEKKLLNV